MAFSSLQPFTLNRGTLPRRLGVLRLIAMSASAVVALQWILPMVLRLAFNGGRVYQSDEIHSLWGPLVPFPVVSVPAWLTILSVAVACISAAAYFAIGSGRVAFDMPYVLAITVLMCGVFPWAIAGFDADPTGIVRTPGPDGYPVGWHWIATPLVLLPIAAAVVGSIAARRERRPRGAAR